MMISRRKLCALGEPLGNVTRREGGRIVYGDGGGGGGSSTTSQGLDPRLYPLVDTFTAQAQQVASSPWQGYTGDRFAGMNSDQTQALDMIRRLKGYSFLSGVRGSRPRDIRALARIVSRVSQLAVAETSLLELDINPVFVLEEGRGAVAADALVVKA